VGLELMMINLMQGLTSVVKTLQKTKENKEPLLVTIFTIFF